MRLAKRWTVLALALLAAGCGRIPDEDAPGPPRTTAELYRDRCASCHQDGMPAPPRAVLRQMRPDAVVAAMDRGMAYQAKGLSPAQRADLAQFLTGSTPGATAAEPPPLMCQAWQNRIDVNRPQNAPTLLDAGALPRFGVKWAFAIPGATRAVAPLAVAGGAVFTGSEDGTVYALDEGGGCLRWSFAADAEVRGGIAVSPWQPGDAAAQPALFFGDMAGNVYRVDAATGQAVWKVRANRHPLAVVTGAPLLHEGRVYVAVASTEQTAAADPDYECCSFQGGIIALDAATGQRIWESPAIRREVRLTGDTNAAGSPAWQPAGAGVWGSPALDTKRKRLYMATGPAHTSPASVHSDAVIALDLDTGKPVWRHQASSRDAWTWSCLRKDKVNCPIEHGPDNGFAAPPLLVALDGGKDILLAAQKAGEITALDPDTGATLWRYKVAVPGEIRSGMAARDGAVFVAASGGIAAFDAATGHTRWVSPAPAACTAESPPGCGAGVAAAPVAVPGLVIAGYLDGRLRALDALTGQEVWAFDAAATPPAPEAAAAPGMPAPQGLLTGGLVPGSLAQGGSFGGGAPVVAYGRIFAASGNLLGGGMKGNAVIVLEPGRQVFPRAGQAEQPAAETTSPPAE